MQPKFFDAHAHAHFPAYGGESRAVVERALESGVEMILVGTEHGTSAGAVALAEQFESGVWAAIGMHPTHAVAHSPVDTGEFGPGAVPRGAEVFDPDRYRALAEHPKVVAIGECGLDYFRRDAESSDLQRVALVSQMELARDVGKPLTIHCRDAFADLVAVFKEKRELLLPEPGTIHFFTGTVGDARELMDLGFSLQFGGVVTFARQYEEVVRYVPLERTVTETDAPYVAPVPYRGRRNEPAYVVEVVKKIAELKGVGADEVAGQVRDNVRRIFGV